MKIMVGCNLLTQIDAAAYPNHMQMWFEWGRHMKDVHFMFNSPRRMSIDNMRNQTAKLALHANCDYLFFYDDDVLLPAEALQKLLDCKAEIAAGMVRVRSYPFKPMAFRYTDETKVDLVHLTDEQIKAEPEVDPVDAIGFSCCLIDMNVIRDMEPPYFHTGTNHTEDVYFCIKTRKLSPLSKIILHKGVKCAHIVDRYTIEEKNLDSTRKFEEDVYGYRPASPHKGDFTPEEIKGGRDIFDRR